MSACFNGQAQLGADTVGAGYQNRPSIAPHWQLDHRTEAADTGEHFGTQRAADQRFDALDQGITSFDVDSGVAVGIAVRIVETRAPVAFPPHAQRPEEHVIVAEGVTKHCTGSGEIWSLALVHHHGDAGLWRAGRALALLYGATVPVTDTQQAAQQAMREVLVRLTGSRDAATDPALAGLVSGAHQYVQMQRATTSGATQVLFDSNMLRDAIGAAGRTVWNPDRPLIWIALPAGAADSLRPRLQAAAAARGLPVVFASDAAADSLQNADATLTAARHAGAAATLVAGVCLRTPRCSGHCSPPRSTAIGAGHRKS